MFKIDAEVPLPEKIEDGRHDARIYKTPGRRGGRSKYPFHLMCPGDSFFVEESRAKAAIHAMRKNCQRWGMRFFSGKEPMGVRIWRLE